jgi:ribosomal protein S18 acetylase RimI-like enzyme
MPFTVRFAEADDFPAWWEARKDALRDHPEAFGASYADALATPDETARERFHQGISGENAIILAIDDSRGVAGMAGFYRNAGPKTAHTAGIWGVYVRPEARGQGVADALMDALIAHARTLPGVLQIGLSVASINASAFRLYERHGFRRWGIRPRALLVDGMAIDEDEMTLMLDAPAHPDESKGSA